jgi:hypothetical protein
VPVWQYEWPEQGYAQHNGRGDRYGPPRHGSPKSGLSPAGRPGKWQDRLERAKRKEKENADVAIAQLEAHRELA